ncbi:aspartate kinase [Dehalococcoidia bacterium]|nr:aspartate kinase [Dehalococcoidia bacterium]
MALIVQKYGGTSVADAARIRRVAERIMTARSEGNDIVVVVSAMGNTTDILKDLARQVCEDPDHREMDVLLSTGEVVSSALLAMALRGMGQPAVSLSGSQAGIRTETSHGRARITSVQPNRILEELARTGVVIVAGFQGVAQNMDITTLGRGASDTTAVALAARLGAEHCAVYTDVEGIFTADPRIVPDARKLSTISYEEMLEMASLGTKVMHPRAIELGAAFGIEILVASSFSNVPGTIIKRETLDQGLGQVRGIAHDTDVAKVTVQGLPDRPGAAASIFSPLSNAGIRVDTIVQNASTKGVTDLTFTVAEEDLGSATNLVNPIAQEIGAQGLVSDPNVGKISIVGSGMQTGSGYATQMFDALFQGDVNIEIITTSGIRTTCIIHHDQVNSAVRALHRAFGLSQATA